MVFGVSYCVVGRADCPYFARAERIAQMLKQSLGLNDRDIRVEMINPVDWSAHLSALSSKFGFTAFVESAERTLEPDRSVLVYRPHTGRLVGGEKAFRKEVQTRYGISCDADWGWLQAMARENMIACESVAKARAARQQAQPLVIAIVGPAGSGKTTLARRIATHYGLVRVSSGDLVRRAALGGSGGEGEAAPSSLSEADLTVLRSSLQSGELVPDSVLLPLISWRLGSEDVRRRGVVLDGYPRTEAQANALRDLEGSLGAVAAVLKLEGLSAAELTTRLQGRRIDPVLEDLYHTSLLLPSSALVLSRLTVRAGDGIESNLHPQLRQYDHHVSDVLRLFRGLVREIDARGSSVDEVLSRCHEVVSPLAAEVARKRMEAAAITAAATKDQPRPQSAFDAAPSAGSSSPLMSGSVSRGSPVLNAVTPVFTVAARLPELSSSRRGSLQSSASASALPSSTLVPAADSRRGSRRNSGSNLGDKLGGTSLSSRPGSRGSSKPSSRRGSATGLSAAALAAAGGVAVHSASGSPVLGSSASSGALNRRVSARRSARASGGVPLVPAGSLRDTAAAASSVSAGSSAGAGATAAPRIPADAAGAAGGVSRPVDVKRSSASKAAAASSSLPSAVSSAASAGDEEDVVQLHPKRGSSGSKRSTATGSTAATTAASSSSTSSIAPAAAAAAASAPLRSDDWADATPAQDESDGLSDDDAAREPLSDGDDQEPEEEQDEEA